MANKDYTPIPKIIHYCWFGSNEMEKIHKRCLKSWRKNLPEFHIMKWDESNIKIFEHPFLTAAYELEKWAFVSDYIRLKKLYEYGGIYLDTDMLLLKPLDEILNLEAFFGAENPNFINGAIIGTKKKNPFIKKCLLQYDDVNLNKNTKLSEITIPQLITSTFRSTYSFKGNFDEVRKVPGMTVLPPLYFYSLPYKERNLKNKKKYIIENSYGVHLWDESWKDLSEFTLLRKRKYLKGFKKVFQRKGKDYSFSYLKRIFVALIRSRI